MTKDEAEKQVSYAGNGTAGIQNTTAPTGFFFQMPKQEPLFWYRPCSNGMYEGPIHNAQIEEVRKQSGAWVPLVPSTTPPAAPTQEPVWCNHCNGSGRMVRDPDIGTDQECFVCDGAGVPAAPTQEPVASAAYDMVDRFLRNNLSSDDDYAEYSAALDVIYTTPPAAQPVFKPCSCRWNGETQVQQCTLHAAHIEAIHEWAERAKTAESKLKGRTNEQET